MPTLVVARFNESLDWLSGVPEDWSVFIYNKGEPVTRPSHRSWVCSVPNVGREAETFCRHNAIFSPDDFTVYLQGNPLDHCQEPIRLAQDAIQAGEPVAWLGRQFDSRDNVKPHTVEELRVGDVWHRLFGDRPFPPNFVFPAGAQAVVRRDRVQSRPPEWWRLAHGVAATDNWTVPHCFERLWPTIYE